MKRFLPLFLVLLWNQATAQIQDDAGTLWTFDDGTTQGLKGWHASLEVKDGVLIATADGKYSSPVFAVLATDADGEEYDRVEIRARREGPTAKANGIIFLLNNESNQRAIGETFSEFTVPLAKCRGYGKKITLALRWPYSTPTTQDKIYVDWIHLGRSRKKRIEGAYEPHPIPPFETRVEWREPHPLLETPVRLYATGPDQLKELVSGAAALSDETLVQMVPTFRGVPWQKCPKCGWRSFEWDPAKPEQATCKHCKTVYPSKEFPADRRLTANAYNGTEVVYHYWQKDGKGEKFFIPSIIANARKRFLEKKLALMARLYLFTKDPKLARKIALILNRFAEVFPN